MTLQQLRILSITPSALRPGEIAVDLFAGGGGWSEGFQWATGVPPAIAVNHDAHSIAMHTANHPETEHFHEDVFAVDPKTATRGRGVGWLHLSPDCRHFSRAKGAVPNTARALSKKIRGLAWVGVRWVKAVRPRIMSLENVAEFTTWGPLHQQGPRAGHPNKRQAGTTFRKFVAALQALGYVVEWRTLKACDHGAPTSRTRLFLIARNDGQAIVWPKPTHGPKTSKPYRTAAECIDWSIPIPSIFDRKKPLAEATLRRIAEGIRRYVINAERPFLVNLTHGGRLESIDDPMATVTGAHRGEKALVAPALVRTDNTSDGRLRGIGTTDEPLRTITTRGSHALVAAFMAQHNTGEPGHPMTRPVSTIVGKGCTQGLVACSLEAMYSNSKGQPIDAPMPTLTAQSNHHALVAAFLTKYYGNDTHGQGMREPMHTVPTVDRFGLVTVVIQGEEFYIADIGMRMLQPRELARAQGFPDSYLLTGTKTQQVARIGNSVPPHFPAAIVAANLEGDRDLERAA